MVSSTVRCMRTRRRCVAKLAVTISLACSIVCPWHRYKISLTTGEGLYVGIDIETRAQQLKSKGPKQRVHLVELRDGGVFVADSHDLEVPADTGPLTVAIGPQPLPSDDYACKAFNPGAVKTDSVPLHSSVPARGVIAPAAP